MTATIINMCVFPDQKTARSLSSLKKISIQEELTVEDHPKFYFYTHCYELKKDLVCVFRQNSRPRLETDFYTPLYLICKHYGSNMLSSSRH